MESNGGSPAPDGDQVTRRSKRVVNPPATFQTESSQATKRKRDGGDEDHGMVDDDDELSELSELDDDDESEEESDEDADAYVSEKKSKKKTARRRKPAVKRVKTTNGQNGLSSLPTRPKKAVRTTNIVVDEGFSAPEGSLFYNIFESSTAVDEIAEQWLSQYKENGDAATTELVNFVLQCAGCNIPIDEDDIRDEENCQNRLTDIQSTHQDKSIVDYPLIAKGKGGGKPFRDLLFGFFNSLINLLHSTEILYEDNNLVNTLYTWVATLSSSTLRPFRHTATTVALMFQTGLVSVVDVLDKRTATLEMQLESARKSRNKSRIAEVRRALDDATNNRSICQDRISAFFETVFVHRYRDVDPKIRTDCVEALGTWIWSLPSTFLQPEYLRYLGWMLSDVTNNTRQEVLRQLSRIFKRDAQKVGHFIERFRGRIVEIATRDSEASVRVSAIFVTEVLRAAGMLEPNDVDEIGRMIFDLEPRVRKAVISFFMACVNEMNENMVERAGGADAVQEAFGSIEDDDFSSPQEGWLTIKSLAELLSSYDLSIQESENPFVKRTVTDIMTKSEDADARISLAAQALLEKMPEVRNWEMIAGYLLYDHSTSSKFKRSKSNISTEQLIKSLVAPRPEEEVVLLEVLGASAKVSLNQNNNLVAQGKKLSKLEITELHDNTALQLAAVIRRLLNKYGGDASAAASVMKLEHMLDLNIFSHLHQESTAYEKLLDEICTQFNRHNNREVLVEAAIALLHARSHDELEEMVDVKLATLWDEAIDTLRSFDKNYELGTRGNIEISQLSDLGTVLLKIGLLSKISDCCTLLEAEGRDVSSSDPAISILANVVHRGQYDQADANIDDAEDEAVGLAIEASLFYFMWKVKSMQQMIQSGAGVSDKIVDYVSNIQDKFWTHLVETFSTRAFNDDLQLLAAGTVCDLHVLMGSLRPYIEQATASGSVPNIDGVVSLVRPIEPGLVKEFIFVLDGAEKIYAKRARKTLNDPAEDEDPMDEDDEDEDEDEDRDQSLTKLERMALELQAEKNLCELAGKYVLAISAKLLDFVGDSAGKLHRRLQRNQNNLGPNYKEVISYLDEAKIAEALNGRRKAPRKASAVPAKYSAIGLNGASTNGNQGFKSATLVENDSDSDLSDIADPDADDSPEGLRRRELLDDDIEDEPEADRSTPMQKMTVDDDILGD
ncbi:Cohesin subunit psc3 [Ceratocystis lukuohia]|uniref:Cohesin subunit psc3 n=1 Tax=Ceratocystis lukuohia TaxID=2019550 RepID=A0ABR4MGP5_9PEZI